MAACFILDATNQLILATAETFPNCSQYALATNSELSSVLNAFAVDWEIVGVAFGSVHLMFVAGLSIGLMAAMLRRLR